MDNKLKDIIIDLLESKDIDFDMGDAVYISDNKDMCSIDNHGWISLYFPLSFLQCEKLNIYPKNKKLRQSIEDFIDYHFIATQSHIWDFKRNTLKEHGITSEKDITYESLLSVGLKDFAQEFKKYYNREGGTSFWIKVFSWVEDNRVNFGMRVENDFEAGSITSYQKVSCELPVGASYTKIYDILKDTLYSLTSQL